MDVIVLDSALELGKSVSMLLISFGLKGVPVSGRAEAFDVLKQYPEISVCIVDIDNALTEGALFITELKNNPDLMNVKIIVHTTRKIREIQSAMAKLGVLGYLRKPFDPENTYYQLRNILSKIFFSGNEQRKHIRIKPDPDELLRIHFCLKNNPRKLFGRVINISMSGMAVELLNPLPKGVIIAGTDILQLHCTLDYRQFISAGRILIERGKVFVIRFNNLSAAAKSNLARYIFKRISG